MEGTSQPQTRWKAASAIRGGAHASTENLGPTRFRRVFFSDRLRDSDLKLALDDSYNGAANK